MASMQFKKLSYVLSRLAGPLLPETLFQILRFRKLHGFWPDLKKPQKLSEKILARFLYDRDPRAAVFADKLATRDYVTAQAPDCKLPRLYNAYKSFDEIEWDALPERFVIKGNHGSGMIYLVRDKSKLDKAEARKECETWLKTDFFYYRREHSYRNLPRYLMIEEFLQEGEAVEPPADYKFFVAHGKVMMIVCDVARFQDHSRAMFDADWNLLPITYAKKKANETIARPPQLESMRTQALALAKGFEFLRVDYYVIGNDFYLGELTCHPEAGNVRIDPAEWDIKLGQAYGAVLAGKVAA